MITESHKNWFETEKGITSDTLTAFGIRSEDADWVVFPYEAGDKKRYIGPGERSASLPVRLVLNSACIMVLWRTPKRTRFL